jgi:DNA processing protein
MSTLVDFVALSWLPFGESRDVLARLRGGDSPSAVLEDVAARRAARGADATPGQLRARAAAALARARAAAIEAVSWGDPRYPAALAAIADPPPVLWARGNVRALEKPAVALVGSRAGSAYALAVADRLAGDLAARGLVVVSGLARGVDSAAHRAALAVRGATVAVMGCGADRVYPAEHETLARDIAAEGAILSELAPGTPPLPRFFPRRNRIISGLVRAVVVIEAGERSGSLITARCALEQGRDVLAVPGNVLNGRNRGSHGLLRDGAKIVESADDILEELGFGPGRDDEPSPGDCPSKPETVPHDPVLAALAPGEASDLDGIAERSGLTAAKLLPRLFDLELRGLVRRAGGGRFVRIDRSC